MSRRSDDFYHAHPMLRDVDDPETFYDYVGEWREAQRQRRVLKWVAFAAFLGLVIGVGILIFAYVH